MEKQRCKSESKSFRRLLNILFFSILFVNQLYSQSLSLSEINSLRIRPVENQNLYTKNDIKFEVLIPKVKASQVQLISNNQAADITFKTMRKNEDYENGGTLIELWFSFEKKGTYTLNPLQISIQGRKRNLYFQQITVQDDPATQQPRIVIKFDNGTIIYSDEENFTKPVFNATAGNKIALTVYLQYASQLMNFNWDIPKDAIFSQTNSYEIMEVKYREKNISHDLIPVASFEWISLAKGIQKFPKMKMTATAYSGVRYDIIIPELEVAFKEGHQAEASNKVDTYFDAAFSQNNLSTEKENGIIITSEICTTLAEMYSRERNAIFNQKNIRKERQLYELENNLPVNYKGDSAIRLIAGALLLFIGALILLFISIHDKKSIRILISILILISSLALTVYGFTKRMEKYGICTGCTIYSIPEETAEAKSEMGAGNKVLITENTGKWLYIELGESGGWCKAENIIIIR